MTMTGQIPVYEPTFDLTFDEGDVIVNFSRYPVWLKTIPRDVLKSSIPRREQLSDAAMGGDPLEAVVDHIINA